MAITSLPTFSDDEILSAGKLNELRNAIETKFSGAISGADIAWPLVAQGNLDMAGYSILGVKNFQNVLNADEYTTMQAAIDAAEAAGGGAIFIPPNTTIEAQGLTIDVGDITIFGVGSTSIIKFPTSPTSDMITTAASLTGLRFLNVKFDGNSGAGTALNAITAVNAIDLQIDGCEFNDFSGDCIDLQDDLGAACQNVRITNCDFVNGDGYHIQSEGLTLADIRSNDFGSGATTTGCINLVPSSNAQMEFVSISGNHIASVTGHGIRMISNGGSDYGDCIIKDNYLRVLGTTKSGIICGESGTPMKNCVVAGNVIENATDDGIQTYGPGMVVNDNIVRNCTDDGIVCVSDDLVCSGNLVKACGGTGINISNCSEVALGPNTVIDCTGAGYTLSTIDFLFCTGNAAQGNGSVSSTGTLTNVYADASNAFSVGTTANSLLDNTLGLYGSMGISSSVSIGSGSTGGSNVSDAFNQGSTGSPLVHRSRVTVNQTDSSPKTLWTVPAGAIWAVHRCYVRTKTAWDGAGTDLDIGISGGDTDGFIDGSGITGFPETAQISALDPSDRGALLYTTREISYAVDATGGAVNIIATITAGGGTTGVSDVFLEYSIIKDQDE